MRKRDRGRAHFYRRIRRENGKMLDGENQNEQPAAAMAMPGVNYHENAVCASRRLTETEQRYSQLERERP